MRKKAWNGGEGGRQHKVISRTQSQFVGCHVSEQVFHQTQHGETKAFGAHFKTLHGNKRAQSSSDLFTIACGLWILIQ